MGDIILFALIAAFVISRLYKVLGDSNYEHDISKEKKEAHDDFMKELNEESYDESRKSMIKQIDILSGIEAELSESDRAVFDKIRETKPTFTADEFLEGAESAFEIIIKAFSEHDKKTLEALLSPEIYDVFAKEIERRIASNQKIATTIVSVNNVKIKSAKIVDNNAHISVRFESEQIKVIRDLKTNEIIGGSSSNIKKSKDIWTFSKAIRSKNNTWKLIETDQGE